MEEKSFTKQILGVVIGVGIGILIILGIASFNIISPQERGVVTRLGSINRVLDDGLHFKIPFVERVTKMDIQIQAIPVTEFAYSKDAQTVSAEVTLNYSLNPGYVDQVFREVKKDYKNRLVIPAIKESIKSVFSKYTAQGLLDNRGVIPGEIRLVLEQELNERGITVSNVLITNLDFDDQYENAVRNKQVQEQQALAQINITKQEEEKKKQEILKAQALSEKTRLEAAALASQNGEKVIEKIYAEAALKAAEKWDGRLPTQFVPGSTIPFINVK